MAVLLARRRIFRLYHRGTVVKASLLLLGAVLGGALFYWLGNLVEYQIGRESLANYTARLEDQGEGLGSEAARGMRQILHDQMPACSDADLAFMRALTIASEHLADAGRVHEGRLVCSALIGRLPSPVPIPAADVVSGGWSTWTSVWPAMPSSLHGHFLETDGVFTAINEQTLRDHEESPPRVATEFLYDRQHHRMLKSFGPDLPVTVDEIAANQPIERNGMLYQPLCRESTIVCAVSFEPKSAILKLRLPLLLLRISVGAALGMLLVAVGILLDFRRISLEAMLRKAIRKGGLTLAYQPIVDLETETIVGVEALARWIKRDGASVPPDIFITVAEDRGFVRDITRLVMHRAFEELGDLLAKPNFHVNLNITSQDLCDPEFLPELEEACTVAAIPRANVGLELTERSTADPSIGTDALPRLKEAGYTLYIDDFGTGYSSLAYLHRLSVDAIKIDRTFTQTVGTASVTASVVPQILDMARQLELRVVIEGIETREQAEYFRQARRGSLAQGWLYGRPVSAKDLRKLIGKRV